MTDTPIISLSKFRSDPTGSIKQVVSNVPTSNQTVSTSGSVSIGSTPIISISEFQKDPTGSIKQVVSNVPSQPKPIPISPQIPKVSNLSYQSISPVVQKIISRDPRMTNLITNLVSYRGGVSRENISMNQFKFLYPNVSIPSGKYGEYDIVTIRRIAKPGMFGDVSESYIFNYSQVARHKIAVAGNVENYDIYLSMVREHPELVAAYSFTGGKGVGPFGILPSMGVDLAMASNRPGITGASEREEILIRYLNKVKGGSPSNKPSWSGLGWAIIENPFVQITGGEALAMGTGALARSVLRTGVRSAPRIIPKLPGPAKKIIPRFISATSKLGGPAEKNILQTTVGRNFMRWATEGAVPVVKTTPKVIASSHTVKKLLSGPKASSYVDDVGNILLKATNEPIGYVDDFSRVILYKPQRYMGLAAEREFTSPQFAKKYAELLKKGITKPELDIILRGETGENAWIKLQTIAEQSGYKKKFLRGVEYPHTSKTIELSLEKYPRYIPSESFLTESEAVKQAILSGKTPGMEYGSLYNVQSDILRELGMTPELAGQLIPEEFLYSKTLPGEFTIALKKTPPSQYMKNIWALNKQKVEEAAASLIRQPTRRIISEEEKALVRILKEGGSVYGKGISKSLQPQFMIPSKAIGFDEFVMFFGLQPELYIEEQKNIPKIYGKGELVTKPVSQFKIPSPKSEFEKLMTFLATREMQHRTNVITSQFPIQKQRKSTSVKSRYSYKTPVSPIPESVFKGPPVIFGPVPPKGEIEYPSITPPIIPFMFPGMGGKVGTKGKLPPYSVRYYNEYEALQQLMREVIF